MGRSAYDLEGSLGERLGGPQPALRAARARSRRAERRVESAGDAAGVPLDCRDGFGAAYYGRPERYLEPEVQAGMSWLALQPPDGLRRGTERLRADLGSGEWDRRHGHLRIQPTHDAGYRLAIAGWLIRSGLGSTTPIGAGDRRLLWVSDAPIDLLAAGLLGGAPCIETIPGTEVRTGGIQGRGLFALRAWEPRDVFARMDGQVVDVTRYPAVVDALEWNALTPERLLVRAIRTSYGFMNHSGRPNVVIDGDGRTMRADRPIAPGDELTLDYFAQPVPEAYLASAEAAALRASTS